MEIWKLSKTDDRCEDAKETFGRRQCGIRDYEIFETLGPKIFSKDIRKNLGSHESLLKPFLDVHWKRLDEDSVALGIQIDEYANEKFGRR